MRRLRRVPVTATRELNEATPGLQERNKLGPASIVKAITTFESASDELEESCGVGSC